MITPNEQQQQYIHGLLSKQAPQNGRQAVDAAIAQGMQQGQQQYQTQKLDQASTQVAQQMNNTANAQVLQSGLLDVAPQQAQGVKNTALARQYYNAILQNTNDYMNAQAAGNQAAMDAATQKTNIIRDAGTKLGIDMTAFGSDKNAAEKQAAMQVFEMNNSGNLLGQSDSGSYYDQQYDYYLNAGMSRAGADRAAARDAKQYQSQRVGQLQDEFFARGINPQTGAINNYGVQMISMLNDESPEAVKTIAAMLPGPLQDYVANWQERFADSNLGRQKDMATFNQELALKMLQAQTDSNIRLQDNQAAHNMATLAYRASHTPAGRSTSGTAEGRTSTSGESDKDAIKVARLIESSRNTIAGGQQDNAGDGATIDANQEELFKMYKDGKIPKQIWEDQIYPALQEIQTFYQRKYGY